MTATRLLIVVCLCVFGSTMSWRAVDPMLPVMALDFGVGMSEVVLLATAYSTPFAATQLVFGPLGDAWGRRRLIRIALGVLAASMVLMALAPTLALVMAARVLGGAFSGGINPVAMALLAENFPVEKRQVALGRFLVAHISGQMLGAAAAGFLVDLIGWRAVFMLGALVVMAILGCTAFLPKGAGETRTRTSLRGLARSYRTILKGPAALPVMGALMCEGILVLGLIAFVPAMLVQHQAVGSAPAGIVIASFALGGLLFGLFVRPILASLGPWNMMRAGGLAAGGSFILSALPVHWSAVAVMFAFTGFGFYMMHNTIQLHATELAPLARGAGLSVASFSFFAGQGIGPVIGAAVAERAGLPALFVAAGVLTVLLGMAAPALISARLAPRQQPTV